MKWQHSVDLTIGSMQFDGELFEHVFNNLEVAML